MCGRCQARRAAETPATGGDGRSGEGDEVSGGRDRDEGNDDYLHRGLLLRNSGGCFSVEDIHIAGVWRLRDIRPNFNIENTTFT